MTFAISIQALVGIVSIVGCAALTIGIVRGSLQKFLSHKEHSEICHGKMVEVYNEIKETQREFNDKYTEMYGMIKEIHGSITKKR